MFKNKNHLEHSSRKILKESALMSWQVGFPLAFIFHRWRNFKSLLQNLFMEIKWPPSMRAFSCMLKERHHGAIVESERAAMIFSCYDLFFVSTFI
jgi:hypothetical protein